MDEIRVITKGIPLTVRDADVEPGRAMQIRATERAEPMYGGDERGTLEEKVYDALPSAIAKRVREIMPEGFAIKEMELTLSVDGKLFGCGVGGEVKVTFGPAGAGTVG